MTSDDYIPHYHKHTYNNPIFISEYVDNDGDR